MAMAYIQFTTRSLAHPSDSYETERVYIDGFDLMNPLENNVELWAVRIVDEGGNVERIERYADERDYFSATHNVYGRVILDEHDAVEPVSVCTNDGWYDFPATVHYSDAIDADED